MIAVPFRQQKRHVLVLLTVVSLLAALCLYFFFPTPTLMVMNLSGDRQEAVIVIPVSKGSQFTIQYIHSKDMLPVHEVFLVDDKYNLLLSEERFIMLGAGMGESEGELVYEGQWTVVRNINREASPFYLRVSSIAEQKLVIDDRVIKLWEIAPESGRLKFEIRKIPRVYLILRGED